MKTMLLNDGPQKTYAVIFEQGDELMAGLQHFAEQQRLTAASFTGVGAFQQAVLGFYDLDRQEYLKIPVEQQVEVLALVGDISLDQDKPKVHAHVVVGQRDGSARGGHVLEARVRPTLEVILEESPAHLRRRFDPASGLALISG